MVNGRAPVLVTSGTGLKLKVAVRRSGGLSAPVMESEALLPPEPTSTEFTSFCSGGLPCGRGQAAVTPSSSSNPGTGNSEAENRSLLTAESVTR